MTRICPKCILALEASDFFFCSRCGVALPHDVVKTDRNFVHYVDYASSSEKKVGIYFIGFFSKIKELFTLNGLLVLFLALVVVGLPPYLLYKKNAKSVTPFSNNIKPSVPVNLQHVNTPLSLRPAIFGLEEIYSNVPYEVDFVAEVVDATGIFSIYSQYDPQYEELFKFLNANAKGHFVTFLKHTGETYNLTYIFLLREPSTELDDTLLSTYPWLYQKKIDNVLVISTDSTIFENIKSVKSGLEKNVTQNYGFVIEKAKLPKSGKIQLITLTKEADTFFDEDLAFKNVEFLRDFSNQFRSSNFDSIVLD